MIFDLERRYATSHDDLRARVFLGAASESGAPLTSLFHRVRQARGYPGLQLEHHSFPDENHGSVIGATISRGLRSLYGSW